MNAMSAEYDIVSNHNFLMFMQIFACFEVGRKLSNTIISLSLIIYYIIIAVTYECLSLSSNICLLVVVCQRTGMMTGLHQIEVHKRISHFPKI